MSSLYDSLPITSCCRTVCEAMGVDCGDAPAPANEAVLAMCDRAFENIPKTAVFGQRFFFARRNGRRLTSVRMPRRERRGIFRKMGKAAVPMSAADGILFAPNGLYTEILAFINAQNHVFF